MRARLVAFCAVGMLVGTACGSRLPASVLDQVDSRSAAQLGASATGGGAGQGSGSETATPQIALGGAGSEAAGPGGATAPGSGSGGTAGASPTSPCASFRSGAPGVTATEIKVASIVTDSGPLPGATEGSYRGAAAYFGRVNALGGLCGRRVTILKGDDGLDPARARSEFERLEPQVFAFVGSFSVADSGYIDLIRSTGVPYVSLTVDPSGADIHNVMPKTTRDHVNTGPFVWWKQQHPGVTKAGMLYADVGGVSSNVPGFAAAIRRAGFQMVSGYPAAAQVTSPDYTAEVRKAQDSGVQFLYLFAFEVNMHVRFVRSMRQQNYDPPIKGALIAYNSKFSQLLGTQGDGWENNLTYLQFLDPNEPSRSARLREFIDWNNRLFPGSQLDLFPVSGWGYAALFADAMSHLQGGVISRQALIDALYRETTFDGGGIQGTIDPRTGLGPPCWNMAVHRGGRWVREYPTNALYECRIGENYKFK